MSSLDWRAATSGGAAEGVGGEFAGGDAVEEKIADLGDLERACSWTPKKVCSMARWRLSPARTRTRRVTRRIVPRRRRAVSEKWL